MKIGFFADVHSLYIWSGAKSVWVDQNWQPKMVPPTRNGPYARAAFKSLSKRWHQQGY